jgi:hypothetical protein
MLNEVMVHSIHETNEVRGSSARPQSAGGAQSGWLEPKEAPLMKAIENGHRFIVDSPSYKMVDLSIVMWPFTRGYLDTKVPPLHALLVMCQHFMPESWKE